MLAFYHPTPSFILLLSLVAFVYLPLPSLFIILIYAYKHCNVEREMETLRRRSI